MADWRKLAKALVLADGRIDNREAEIIRRELLADRKLDRDEFQWLIEVRKNASATVPAFDQLVFGALKQVVLADGNIDAKEAAWLRKFIFADGKVDDAEKKFLTDLKNGAKTTSPEFDALYKDCCG